MMPLTTCRQLTHGMPRVLFDSNGVSRGATRRVQAVQIGETETDPVADRRGNLLRAPYPGLGGADEQERRSGSGDPHKASAMRRYTASAKVGVPSADDGHVELRLPLPPSDDCTCPW